MEKQIFAVFGTLCNPQFCDLAAQTWLNDVRACALWACQAAAAIAEALLWLPTEDYSELSTDDGNSNPELREYADIVEVT